MQQSPCITATHFEYPSCPLCGSGDRHTMYDSMQDDLHGLPGQFGIARCRQCDLLYLSPRPAPKHLATYYPEDYSPFAGATTPQVHNSSLHRLLSAFLYNAVALPYRVRFGPETLALPPFGGRRLLDVGCGAGDYLQQMQQLGWDVCGVDLSPTAVEESRRRVGTSRVLEGTIEQLDPLIGNFDLIMLNHCLEHVADPCATLTEASRRLSADGKIKIVVPDAGGIEPRLFGRSWVGWDVPRHLCNFSEQTLRAFLTDSGFHVLTCRPQYTSHSFGASVDRALTHKLRILPSNRLHKALLGLIHQIALLSRALGNRGAMEIMAQKIAID